MWLLLDLCHFIGSLSLVCLDRLIECVVVLHIGLSTHVHRDGAVGEVGDYSSRGGGDDLVTGIGLDIEGTAIVEGRHAAGIDGGVPFGQDCDGSADGRGYGSVAAVIRLIIDALVIAILGIFDGEDNGVGGQSGEEEAYGMPAYTVVIGMVRVVVIGMIGVITVTTVVIRRTAIRGIMISRAVAGMVTVTTMEAAGTGVIASGMIAGATMISSATRMVTSASRMIAAAAADHGSMVDNGGMVYDSGMAYSRMTTAYSGMNAATTRMTDGRMRDCGFIVLGRNVSVTGDDQ